MLSFSDLWVLLPSFIAIVLAFVGFPLAYYLIARLLLKLNLLHYRAMFLWCYSGINLSKVPKYCKIKKCNKCRNWTCPNFTNE